MEVNEVTKARGAIYGHPADHFGRTTGILNALGFCRRVPGTGEVRDLDALDWPVVMVADKLARLAETRDHEDGWKDVQGYGWTAEAVIARRQA